MHENALYLTAVRAALLCRHQRQAEVLRCLEAVCGAAEVQAEPWAHVRRKRRLGAQLSLSTSKPADSCQVYSTVIEETIMSAAGCSDLPSLAAADVCCCCKCQTGSYRRRQAPAA